MEEEIDVLDEKGEKTGEIINLEEAHKLGLLHRTVHVWLLNSNQELLLQKRSKDKIVYPSLWDISAAGHISAGETSIKAAQKETAEEIGLDLPASEFNLISTIRQPISKHRSDFIDNEFNDIYLVRKDVPLSAMKFPPDEVEDLKWIGLQDLKRLIDRGDKDITPHEVEYKILFEYLAATQKS